MEPVVCIVGAIKEEIAGIKRAMTVEENLRLENGHLWLGAWEGRRVALARSGIGQTRARRTLERVCEKVSPSLVISMGYAGGLALHLNVGDLVLADSVRRLSPRPGAGDSRAISLLSPHLERAEKLAPEPHCAIYRGGLLTVDEIIYKPEQKRELARSHSALAVEMETYALAELAEEKKIPFLSVRSVTDTAEHELLNFAPMQNASGEVSALKAGWYVLSHPGSARDLVQLRAHSQKATANLARFISRLLRAVD